MGPHMAPKVFKPSSFDVNKSAGACTVINDGWFVTFKLYGANRRPL